MPKPLDMLLPIFALAFWTFLVLNVLGISRIRAGRRRLISADDFRLGESDRVPAQVRLTNRNYMNLLELPVLFYVICLIVHITGIGSSTTFVLAWLFVALRIVHSVIHLTYNHVMHRLSAFVAGNTTLLALWIVSAVALSR